MAKKKKKSTEDDASGSLLSRFLKNPLKFIGIFIIVALIIVMFVLPSTSSFSCAGSQYPTFGSYDNDPISYEPGNYFAQYYSMAENYYRDSLNSDNYSFMQYRIFREAFEATVIHKAILREMELAGYSVPVEIVDREIAKLPDFQENGRFSPAIYRSMDNNARTSLWENKKEEMIKGNFLSDVFRLGNPPGEAEFIANTAKVERSFEMAVFPVNDYPDSEYMAFAEENPELFRSGHFFIITVNSSSARDARNILEFIQSGEMSMEDGARIHSSDEYSDKGGDMGIKMAYELNNIITEEADRNKIINLQKDTYSDVVKTASGWSFFYAAEDAQEADLSDAEVFDKVKLYVNDVEGGRMENWAIGQAEDFIALVNEQGYEEALAANETQNRSFGPVSINYGEIDIFSTLSSQSVDELSGAAFNEQFWKAAFSTQINSPSEPVVQGGNVLVLFPVAETQAEESSIEAITSTVDSYWIGNISQQYMQQYFINNPKTVDNFHDKYMEIFPSGGF
ncbi:MAG: SurA N-terminal domain-containing protein [Treponema sp.]|nr:SurA N-terminal domain-containing protein [Treponema sp.]